MRGPVGEAVPGKVFRRQEEFLNERGLADEAGALSTDGAEARAANGGVSYLAAARQREELAAAAPPSTEITWRSLGPHGIPHGQTYGSGPGSRVTVAGRISAIAVDPNDSKHVLAGSAAGGIWETKDGGSSWTPRTDDQPTLSIGAIAFDPSQPSRVYAGTGEGNSAYRFLGQGILVSEDGGSSWTRVAEQIFTRFGFYKLVVDGGGRLLVATTGGAAASSDGGANWELLHSGLTWDISLSHRHAGLDEILMATPDGLFRMETGQPAAQVAVPGLPALDARRERMAVHVSDSGEAYVFAATQGQARLWHRPSAGGDWQPIDLPSFPLGELVENVLSVKQARYDWYVAAPLDRDDIVYLGAIELVRGTRSNGQWEWTDISTRVDHGDSIHPDQHAMAFDPQQPDVLYAGSDGGIFRSPDRGDSWESLNAGLAISEVEYLAQRPDDPMWLLAGLQDNGTIRRDADDVWSQVGLGDGGDCGTDMAAPDVCFHSYFGMYMERSPHRGDAGSWKLVTPPGDPVNQPALFYPPVEVNDDVVVKAGHTVYLSRDRADHWSQMDLPQQGIASALAIPTHDTVIVGTTQGDVYRVEFQNGDWGAPTALTKPANGWISDLLVDPAKPDRYWATFSAPGGVFRSDDAGGSWTNVTGSLPSIPVNAIVCDPGDTDRVWVACDVGVFESTDAGGSWAVFGTGLPNALAVDLLFFERDRLLRVGTRSRGAWEVSV
jgi:photosystem II stability/assembly factor-like uncharacterized protein